MAASPLPSQVRGRGGKCYATPTFSKVSNAPSVERNPKWLPHPFFLEGPKEGGSAT